MTNLMTRVTRAREGFALPAAILLLLCMTAGVMGAFSRNEADVRAVDNNRAETEAFAVAEAGLHRYLARGRTTPADTTMTVPGGTARVRVTRLRALATSDTILYLVRSDGIVAGGRQRPEGRRTVAQYAYHTKGRFRTRATWVSLGGLTKTGESGIISGSDVCAPNIIGGVGVPAGDYAYTGDGLNPVFGMPAIDNMGTVAEAGIDLKIDWGAIVAPLSPATNVDLVVCFPGTLGYDSRLAPCGSWPSEAQWADPEFWPMIIVNGSMKLPTSGRGTLAVTGNLTMGGNIDWSGIVMVGNALDDNGSGTIRGAVVSGLNALTGASVDRSIANGSKDYKFDSCAVARAADRQSRFLPVSNAWIDNMQAW